MRDDVLLHNHYLYIDDFFSSCRLYYSSYLQTMTCLVHNPRYRSLFHAVVNDLRHEKRTPLPILRKMPNQCCTCNDIDKLTLISVLINDKDNLNNLKKLTDQIDQDKQNNPKLVFALNRLENFIKENRSDFTPNLPPTVSRENSISASNDSMDFDKPSSRKQRKPSPRKKRKPLKNGTFLFLPYQFGDKLSSNSLISGAKKLQRGRFIGRHGYIATIEKQHAVCINMVTSSTTERVTETLKNAKEGIGNITIHNRKDILENDDGEWVLVRPKKGGAKKTNKTDFEALLDDLQDRWDSFLTIRKRKNEEEENEGHAKKK